MSLETRGDAARVLVGLGSASLLSVLGVQPALGRSFLPSEEGTAPEEGTRVAPADVLRCE